MRKTLLIALLAILSIGMAFGQTPFFNETVGTVSGTTTIAAHETNNGFSEVGATYSGTADLRATTVSSGYTGASGLANVFFTNIVGRSLLIEGINSSAYTNITMSLGHYKSQIAGNNELSIEVSSDGSIWNSLTYSRPTGTGTASWLLINPSGTIPAAENLRIRFTQTTTISQFRIDDLILSGFTSTTTPTIYASGTLNAFSTTTGTPSASQSYTLSGSNLTANINLAALAGFEYSTNNSTWTSTLSVANTFNGLVYVRLTGTTLGSYTGNIVHTSTGATQVDLAVSGSVTAPQPTIVVTGTLSAFTTTVGSPSTSQSYTLSGTTLSSNIEIAALSGYEYSTNNSTWLSSLSLASNYNGLVYVRLTGTTVGPYVGNITHTSTGATPVDLAVTGTVSAPYVPSTFMFDNFTYEVGTTVAANGWSAYSSAGANSPLVDATNLSYPSYLMSAGGSARTNGTTGEDIAKGFDEQTSGEVYCSWLMNITSLPNTTQDYAFFFGDAAVPTGGTNFRGRLYVQRNAENQIRFGISRGSTNTTVIQWTGGLFTGGTYDYAMNTTYMFVMKYKVVAGATNDEVYLFINPTSTVTEPAHTLFVGSADTSSDLANIGSVAIRQSNNTPAAFYDGIRVTNNWAHLWLAPPVPVINVTGTFEPFTGYVNTQSDQIQSYTLSGSNLTGNLSVTAPTGFELSLNGTDGWTGSLSLEPSFSGQIYVRMFAPTVDEYRGNIVHTSPGTTTVNFAVEGQSFYPDVTWNITQSLSPFSSEAGTPSANQSYTLSTTGGAYDITVTTVAPFELSTTGTGDWLTELVLVPSFNGSIYVRMNAGLAGDYTGNITHVTPGASDEVLPISGTATLPAGNYAVDLFFSEYIEGGSNNKSLEIFNGTGVAVDLSDYQVELYANGATAPGNTQALTGSLAHGDVYVISNAASNAAILALTDLESTVTYYNGDDAVALKKISTAAYVDIIGVIGQDPGTQWTADGGFSTLNKTLVRKPTVVSGVTVNPTISTPAVTTDFVTMGTEWLLYDQDYIADLGMHTFNPGGGEMVETPSFDPPAGVYFSPFSVSISTSTVGASIYYTTNGDVPSEASTPFTTPIQVSATTTIKAIAYLDGYIDSAIATAIYTFPVEVANIAALRASAQGATVYKLTGEAVLTFQQTNRNQKYVQDATAAIVIDDPSGIITSTYNLYDGITGITGTINNYSNLIQFTPVANPGAATSTNNVVVPAVRTLATITTDDQAKLLKINNVTLTPNAGGIFLTTQENIVANDASGAGVLRTFPATNYAGEPIPTTPQDIVCLGGQFGTAMQFSPRFLSDFSEASGTIVSPVVTISEAGGTVTLNWAAVDGASTYRIEHSDTINSVDFTLVTTTPLLTWNGTATSKKFYRVIAVQ